MNTLFEILLGLSIALGLWTTSNLLYLIYLSL